MMKTEKILPLALVAMSLLFFIATLAPLCDTVLWNIGAPSDMKMLLSSVIWDHTLLSFIALCGGIAFLACTRRENSSWYLGLPLVVAFAIITISPFIAGLLVIHDPRPPLYHPGIVWTLLSQAVFFLLPLWAALFFWSQRRLGWWVQVMAGITLLMALNALVVTFYATAPFLISAGLLPPPQPQYIEGQLVKTDGEGMLFLLMHYLIGLPVAGLFFLALAGYFWYTAWKSAPSGGIAAPSE